MKLKTFLPVAFAFITQLGFSQSKLKDTELRDSVDRSIKTRVINYMSKADPVEPIVYEVALGAVQDTAQYTALLHDDNFDSGYFDLRKELNDNQDKIGLTYNNHGHTMLFPMAAVKSLIELSDEAASDYELEPSDIDIYFHLGDSPNMTALDPYEANTLFRHQRLYSSAIIIESRFAQATDLNLNRFAFYHEEGHQTKWDGSYGFIDESGFNNPDSLQCLMEYGADHEAAEKLGTEFACKQLARLPKILKKQAYDNPKFVNILDSAYIEEFLFEDDKTDHPTSAQRIYAVVLMEEIQKNKEFTEVLKTLIPDKAKLVFEKK